MDRKAITAALDAAIFSVWAEDSVRKAGIGKHKMRLNETRDLALFLYVWEDNLMALRAGSGLTKGKLQALKTAVRKQDIDPRGLTITSPSLTRRAG